MYAGTHRQRRGGSTEVHRATWHILAWHGMAAVHLNLVTPFRDTLYSSIKKEDVKLAQTLSHRVTFMVSWQQ